MAVVTCSEVVAQCLSGQGSGWKHFVTDYLPFARAVLDYHYPELKESQEATLRAIVLNAQDQNAAFFRSYQGQSEREFLLHLREHVLQTVERGHPAATPEVPLDWVVLEEALADLSALDRQVVWTAILGARRDDIAALLRLDVNTVTGATDKAQELLKGRCDRWHSGLVQENRHLLVREARSRHTNDCCEPKIFLKLLDGQITWRDRLQVERHLAQCWHCVDQLCRFREVIHLSRKTQPLTKAYAEACLRALA